jgi:hypothetical protein
LDIEYLCHGKTPQPFHELKLLLNHEMDRITQQLMGKKGIDLVFLGKEVCFRYFLQFNLISPHQNLTFADVSQLGECYERFQSLSLDLMNPDLIILNMGESLRSLAFEYVDQTPPALWNTLSLQKELDLV